jgi:hypothetical protein
VGVTGWQTQEVLLGSGTVELGDHVGKGSFALALVHDPKKPPKGEVELGVTFTPPIKEEAQEAVVQGAAEMIGVDEEGGADDEEEQEQQEGGAGGHVKPLVGAVPPAKLGKKVREVCDGTNDGLVHKAP